MPKNTGENNQGNIDSGSLFTISLFYHHRTFPAMQIFPGELSGENRAYCSKRLLISYAAMPNATLTFNEVLTPRIGRCAVTSTCCRISG